MKMKSRCFTAPSMLRFKHARLKQAWFTHRPTLEDAEIAMAISNAATDILLRPKADDAGAFRTDAFATVAIAYRRAAGIYAEDQDMRELGTAAVHLLTMATSYLKPQNDLFRSDAV